MSYKVKGSSSNKLDTGVIHEQSKEMSTTHYYAAREWDAPCTDYFTANL